LDLLCSTVSDVDPGSVLGSRTTEPVAAEQNTARQTNPEQPVAQPAAAPTMHVADEDPARDRAEESAPTRGDETVGTPPLNNVAERENRAPSPTPVEEYRSSSPALAEAPP